VQYLNLLFPTCVPAKVQGLVAGLAYGAFSMAYYPDKFAYSQKGTVTSGPSRGLKYIMHTTVRPAVAFSVVSITFASAESFLEEVKGSHHKDPWNSAFAGAAAGMVLGGFFARRFDVASMTALGTGLLMGMVEFNGPNIVTDPVSQAAKKFPEKVTTAFAESENLQDLKEKYPKFKYN
jgi:hypothetical protein